MAEDKNGPSAESGKDEPTKRFDAEHPNPAEAPGKSEGTPTPASGTETPSAAPTAETPSAAPTAKTPSTTTEGSAETVDPDPTAAAEPKKRSGGVRVLAAAVAGVVFVAAVAAAIVFGIGYFKNKNAQNTLDAQAQARDAMCDYAKVIVSYDYNDLDTFFKKVLDGATGQWKDEFDKNSQALRDPLVAGQVRSSGNEVQCGVQSGDENHAVVVVAIGQTITSLGTQNQPQQGQISVVATLDKVDDRWLVSKMDAPLLSP